MFGSRRRLERKLRAHGKAAMATVLATRVAVGGGYSTNDPMYRRTPTQVIPALVKMTVRVEPDGKPPFDAEIDAWLMDTERPWINTAVPVLYDPTDHRKVLFDKSAYQAGQRARWDPHKNVTALAAHLAEQHRQSRGADPVESAADLLASGQRVPGVLKSFAATGTTPRRLGRTSSTPDLIDAPHYVLVVELQFPNLAPVEARKVFAVPPAQVPNLAIGLKLPCVVDTANPAQRFVVDWDATAH